MNGVMPMNITSLRPNPAQDGLQVDLRSAVKQDALLEIYDALGAKVFSDIKNIAAGSNTISLSIKGLSDGIYILRVGGSSKTFVKVQ